MGRKGKSLKGQEGYNKFGSKMIVKEDRGSKDIDVYFPEYNWNAFHRERCEFKRGSIVCPYEPRVFGVGYVGEGKYNSRINGKKTKCYNTWISMLRRCYDKNYQEEYPTYKDIIVCKEWHNFQNFAKWYEENFYFIDNETMCLDKDILVKGNKVYSPDTCIFVPNRINVLFTKSDKSRGKHPIGVCYDSKCKNKIVAYCYILENNKNKRKHLGTFELNQVEEAFLCYKQFKENYIKQVADEYKELIPTKLYDALYRYEVEITD